MISIAIAIFQILAITRECLGGGLWVEFRKGLNLANVLNWYGVNVVG